MGVIFGIVNIIVAIWFFSSAAAVKKKALMWAAIGGIAFLGFKFVGYSTIGLLQSSVDQAALGDLAEQGYTVSERSARELSSETKNEQSTAIGIMFEFFPLILALLGVSYIRARFILGMSYIASLKYKTPLTIKTHEAKGVAPNESPSLIDTVSSWLKKNSKN